MNQMRRCVRVESRMAFGPRRWRVASVGAGGLDSREGEARSPLWPFSVMLLPGKQVGGQRGHSNSRRPLYHERASERRAMALHEGEDDCLMDGLWFMNGRGWRCMVDTEMCKGEKWFAFCDVLFVCILSRSQIWPRGFKKSHCLQLL